MYPLYYDIIKKRAGTFLYPLQYNILKKITFTCLYPLQNEILEVNLVHVCTNFSMIL